VDARDIGAKQSFVASPGHDGKSENVDAWDIGAKQSFVASPGHDGEGEDVDGRRP